MNVNPNADSLSPSPSKAIKLMTPEEAVYHFGNQFSIGQLKTAIRKKKVGIFRGTNGKKLVSPESVNQWIWDELTNR